MRLEQGQKTVQQQGQVLSLELRQAIALLSMSNLELADHVARAALDNPFLEVVPPAIDDGAPVPRVAATGSGGDDMDALGDPTGPSLYAHVFAELRALELPAGAARIAHALCEAIEPTGWLTDNLANIARRLDVPLARVEAVLIRLQDVEPAGLFARDLRECLTLQARRAGCLDDAMAAVLGHLALAGRGALREIAAQTGIAQARLRAALHRLRAFDPKPGLAWDSVPPDPVSPPDLIVWRADDGWRVDLNHSTLPGVRFDAPAAAAVLSDTLADDATRKFVRQAQAGARWLCRATEQRNRTVLRIGIETLRRQRACLDSGFRHLKPMILRDVADALDLHQSTVSRVTASVTVSLPGETMKLKAFFSTGLPCASGGAVSAKAVQVQIRELIAAEDPRNPLSDAAIASRVARTGVPLARRTVAKYRGLAGVPGAAIRRRRAIGTGQVSESSASRL